MSERTLIFRSASMERLDACAAAIGGIAGGIDILTHRHFAASIRAHYPAAKVMEYPEDGNFSVATVKRLRAEGMLEGRYKRVVVLVGNLSGAGHLNVIMAAGALGPVELFNVNDEFRPVKMGVVWAERAGRILLSPLLFFATIGAALTGLLIFAGCAVRRGRTSG